MEDWFNRLRQLDCNYVTIERILELPFGTIKKWESKEREMLAEELVLLKIIITFPWLLGVVDNNYRTRRID